MNDDEDEKDLHVLLNALLGLLIWIALILTGLLIWWPTGQGVPPVRMP